MHFYLIECGSQWIIYVKEKQSYFLIEKDSSFLNKMSEENTELTFNEEELKFPSQNAELLEAFCSPEKNLSVIAYRNSEEKNICIYDTKKFNVKGITGIRRGTI